MHSGGVEPVPPADLEVAAELFHSLADSTRLTIIQHLFNGEHNVRELTEHLGLAQSTISAHLACLKGCGLVTSRPQGRSSYFSLADKGRTIGLLSGAEGLLDATGRAVALCPMIQHPTRKTG